MKSLNKITDYLKENYNITDKTKYETKEINGQELLVSSRLDLISKLKYIEMKENKYNYDFPLELYKAHLEAFSNGTYAEPGNKEKNSFEKYIKTFNKLIRDIGKNGIDSNISMIPVGNNMAIMDGAHRTAISIFYNKQIPIIKFKDKEVKYDAYFFKERLLDPNYLDYMVLEYVKMKKNVYCFCFWPRAEISLKDKAIELLRKKTNVIYDKQINLNYNGYKLFMQQVYHRHDWVGSYENNHKGVQQQLDNCYSKGQPLHLFVVEGSNLDEMSKLKANIRKIFGIGNYSIHSTDNKEETIEMLEILLNDNSIHMLNYGNPDKFKLFNKNLEKFKKLVSESGKNLNDFVIDSSSVMSLYGLREASDIDYMCVAKEFDKVNNEIISNHHNYIKYYKTTIEDLVLNPKNYLVYSGVKFITLDVLKKMKMNRNEDKDRDDVRLINSINNNKFNESIIKFKFALKRFIRVSKINIKKIIVKIFKFVGLYNFARKVITRGK